MVKASAKFDREVAAAIAGGIQPQKTHKRKRDCTTGEWAAYLAHKNATLSRRKALRPAVSASSKLDEFDSEVARLRESGIEPKNTTKSKAQCTQEEWAALLEYQTIYRPRVRKDAAVSEFDKAVEAIIARGIEPRNIKKPKARCTPEEWASYLEHLAARRRKCRAAAGRGCLRAHREFGTSAAAAINMAPQTMLNGFVYAGVNCDGLLKIGKTQSCPLCRMAAQRLKPVGLMFCGDEIGGALAVERAIRQHLGEALVGRETYGIGALSVLLSAGLMLGCDQFFGTRDN